MSKKNNNGFLSISDLWRLSLSHWKWFALSLTACVGLALFYLATKPKLYMRVASIMVREESPGNNSTDSNGDEFNNIGFVKVSNKLTNEIRHITSLDVLMEVARRLQPDADPESILSLAQGIQDRLGVELESEKGSIINLAYKDYSTEAAEKILLLIIQVYNETDFRERRELIENTSNFIDYRLDLLSQDLGMVDDSISTFKSRHKITDINRVSDMYLQQQSESAIRIMELTNQRAMAEYIKGMLEDTSQYRLLLVNSGIDNTVIEEQISLYNSLLMELNRHLSYTSDQNPRIVNLEKEISSMRKNILGTIDMHIKTLDIELRTLKGYNEEATSRIVSNPDQAKYLLSIERDQKVKESLYLYLLQKKEENEISLTYRSAKTRIIDIPHGSDKPTSPKPKRILLVAILLGLLMPFSLLFLRLTLNDSVQKGSDVEAGCDVPFLGEIPFIGHKSLLRFLMPKQVGKNGIIISREGRDPGNEAFRRIRARLEPSLPDSGKVFLVTSPEEGNGKTFVAMNLASVFALGGKRVLLVDGDLRSARASRLLKAEGPGFADCLGGTADWPSLVVSHDLLDILPAGDVRENPAELLFNPQLKDMMETLRARYDLILVDAPASGKLADTEILGGVCDDILMVLQADKFDRRKLEDLEEMHREGQGMFLVLNMTDELES